MKKSNLVYLLLLVMSGVTLAQEYIGNFGEKASAFPLVLNGEYCPFRQEGDTNGDGVLEAAFFVYSGGMESVDHSGVTISMIESGYPPHAVVGYYDFNCDGRDEILIANHIYTRPMNDQNMLEFAIVYTVNIWNDFNYGYGGLSRTGDWDCDGCDEVVFKEDSNQGAIRIVGNDGVETQFEGSYDGGGFWDLTGDGVPELVLNHGAGQSTEVYTMNCGLTSIPSVPDQIQLGQNFPNPFNPTTRIPYALDIPDQTKLTIYNSIGQQVREFDLGRRTAGSHFLDWDGTDGSGNNVASGVYYYQLQVGKVVKAKKMVTVR
jgi:hypothetical protein